MLEVQATIRPDSADGTRHQGDIIVAARLGHPWGRLDRKHLVVALWEDRELEQELDQRYAAGERWPVITLPYARINERTGKLEKQSTLKIDLASIHQSYDVLNREVEKPILPVYGYTSRVSSEEVQPLGWIATAWKWVTGG